MFINKLKIILKLCVALFLLSYIVITNDIARVFEYFFSISPLIWLIFIVLYIVQVAVLTERLSLFFPEHNWFRLMYIRLISIAYGFVLPGQLAVEGVRAYLLAKNGDGYGHSGAAIMVDKLLSMIALLILGLVGLWYTDTLGYAMLYVFFISCVVLMLLLFALCFQSFYDTVANLLSYIAKKVGRFGKLFELLIRMAEHWRTFVSNKFLIFKCFLYGVLFQLVCAVIGALLTYGIGASFNLLDWLWIQALVTFVLMLPLSLGGIGVREGSLIGLLGLIGVDVEQALAVSFGLLALTLLQAFTGVCMGIGFAFNDNQEGK